MRKILGSLLLLAASCGDVHYHNHYSQSAEPMPLAFPPDDVTIGPSADVTWGTDILDDESVVLSGLRSIKFEDTTPANDPYIEHTDGMEVEEGRWYSGEVIWRAGSVAGGNTLAAEVRWYDRADAYLSSGTLYSAAVLSATNTWLEAGGPAVQAPADARFARVRVTKNNTAFEAWVDALELHPAITSGFWYRIGAATSNQSINDSTDTVVVFDTEGSNIGMSYDDTTGQLTALRAGLYTLHFGVRLDSMAAGTELQLTLEVNGVAAMPLRFSEFNDSAGARNMTIHGSFHGVADVGDVLEVLVWHDHGAARNLTYAQLGVALAE